MKLSRPARPCSSRQPDLEALRAVAALMVVTAHLPWYQYFPGGVWPSAPVWLSPRAPLLGIGGFAVVLFLVISGAGLCRLLVLRAPLWPVYLRGRLWKLFSVFWSMAVPVLLLWFAIGWLQPSAVPKAALTLLGLGFVSPDSWAAIFPSWWYIAIAWQVVAVIPLLVFGLRRLPPPAVLALTALVVFASCFVVPMAGLAYAEKGLIISRALEVLGGAFLALELWPEVRERLGVTRRGAAWLVAATIGCMIALVAAGLGGRWIYRAVGLALVAAVVYGRPLERLGAVRAAGWAARAGGMSFAVYVLHEPVMLVVRRFTGAPTGISLGMLAAVSLAAVMTVAVLFTRVSGAVRVRAAGRTSLRTKGDDR